MFFLYLYDVPAVVKSIKIGVFIACANFIIQGISFLVQNFIARNLGASTYGFFGVLQTDFSIFSAIADFGMGTLILAFFGKRATTGQLFRSVFQLRIASSVLTAFIMVLFALIIRRDHAIFWGELILSLGLIFQHAFFDWFFICGRFWKKLLLSKILHSISYTAIMGIALLYFRTERIEIIALAMVLAALPAFFFGITQSLNRKIFKLTKRTLLFFRLMLKAGIPYAISGFASYAYLPVGLYIADRFASAEFLSSYNYGHKILILCSGIMVHFISSNLVTQHLSQDKYVHLKEMLTFVIFIGICTTPLWLFPRQLLQILFFAVQWTGESLDCSSQILRILSMSLLFQAARLSMISTLLKNKETYTYAFIVSVAGAANIIACLIAGINLPNNYIPVFALTGDILITVILLGYYIHRKSLKW